LRDCNIKRKYDKQELLQRLRDIKDSLKYLSRGHKPTIDHHEIREEFTWLQDRYLRQALKHPFEESFQIKRVPNYKWEYPYCKPLWVPRLDQKARWVPFMEHPEQLIE
jgi:hypothetical protein